MTTSDIIQKLRRDLPPGMPVMPVLRALKFPLPPQKIAPGYGPHEVHERGHAALAHIPLDLNLIGHEIKTWKPMKISLGLQYPDQIRDKPARRPMISLRTRVLVARETVAALMAELERRA